MDPLLKTIIDDVAKKVSDAIESREPKETLYSVATVDLSLDELKQFVRKSLCQGETIDHETASLGFVMIATLAIQGAWDASERNRRKSEPGVDAVLDDIQSDVENSQAVELAMLVDDMRTANAQYRSSGFPQDLVYAKSTEQLVVDKVAHILARGTS